jgi:hypothetical protein
MLLNHHGPNMNSLVMEEEEWEEGEEEEEWEEFEEEWEEEL